jgi:hypothetical protein
MSIFIYRYEHIPIFMYIIPSNAQMARRGVLLLPVTAGYLGVAVWLAPLLGVRALILANILNMLLRTCVPALEARRPGIFTGT